METQGGAKDTWHRSPTDDRRFGFTASLLAKLATHCLTCSEHIGAKCTVVLTQDAFSQVSPLWLNKVQLEYKFLDIIR